MNLPFVVSKTIITENFILRVWEASADGPGAHVYETTLVEKNNLGVPTPGAGHQVEEPITVTGLDTVTHVIRIIGATSGTVWSQHTQEPTENIVTIFIPVRFKIGDGGTNTPAANSDVCTTPELIGKTVGEFIIHRANYGPLHPTEHFSFNTGTGEWQLVNGNSSGDTFNEDEEFTIDLRPKAVTNPVHDSVVGKLFGGFVDVNANTNYASTHLRKLIRFAGQCAYTFQAGDTIPIGYIFCFTNLGTPSGTNICTINFLNGNLKWGSTTKTSIDLALYTEAAFVWDGTQWNVVYICDSRYQQVSTIPTGTVLGTGVVNIGDVAAGDPVYTVLHNLNITGDYHVFLQIKSNNAATYFRDNKLAHTFWHDTDSNEKKNRFHFSIQELSGEVQNVSVTWLCIKA